MHMRGDSSRKEGDAPQKVGGFRSGWFPISVVPSSLGGVFQAWAETGAYIVCRRAIRYGLEELFDALEHVAHRMLKAGS